MPDFILINSVLSILACFFSFWLFRFAKELALALGAVDLPNKRKIHSLPTARGGGLCFFIPFVLAIFLSGAALKTKALLIFGGSVIFVIGFLDDVLSIAPLHKLTGQALAAAIPIFSGLNFYMGSSPALRAFFGIITFIWILLLTNAINLSDGIDALAASEGLLFSASLAVFSLILGRNELFFPALTLSLSILGFIPHNRHPAKIFMGDCGSLFIGYTLAVLSVLLLSGDKAPVHILALPILFIVPLADTVNSFIRRILKRKSPFSADRGHFHHKLLDIGFSQRNTTLFLVTITLTSALLSEILMLI